MPDTEHWEGACEQDWKAESVRDFESLEKRQLRLVLHREYQAQFYSEVEFKLGNNFFPAWVQSFVDMVESMVLT